MKKVQKIRFLGWFFLVLGIVSVFWHVLIQDWRYAVWFCNHAMIVVGLAVLNKNKFWLTAMLNWAVIPVSLWMIDFLSKLLFGMYLFRITEYMFVEGWWRHLLGFQHLFTVPLMLYTLYLLGKPVKNAWLGTTLHGSILWIIAYFFITPDYNVNCAHETCVPAIIPGFAAYPYVWPFIAIVMFIVTNWFLVWVFRRVRR
jgi:hypothetical protein